MPKEAFIESSIPDALRYFDSLPDAAYVRQPIVERLFAVSSATVWRLVKNGRIPKPRRLSDRITAWRVGELRRALNAESVQVVHSDLENS